MITSITVIKKIQIQVLAEVALTVFGILKALLLHIYSIVEKRTSNCEYCIKTLTTIKITIRNIRIQTEMLL